MSVMKEYKSNTVSQEEAIDTCRTGESSTGEVVCGQLR